MIYHIVLTSVSTGGVERVLFSTLCSETAEVMERFFLRRVSARLLEFYDIHIVQD